MLGCIPITFLKGVVCKKNSRRPRTVPRSANLNCLESVVETGEPLQFIYLGFYVAFSTVQVISRQVVRRAEETSTYSLLGFCTVNCRPTASNYQLSHLRPYWEPNPGLRGGRRGEPLQSHASHTLNHDLGQLRRVVNCVKIQLTGQVRQMQ